MKIDEIYNDININEQKKQDIFNLLTDLSKEKEKELLVLLKYVKKGDVYYVKEGGHLYSGARSIEITNIGKMYVMFKVTNSEGEIHDWIDRLQHTSLVDNLYNNSTTFKQKVTREINLKKLGI